MNQQELNFYQDDPIASSIGKGLGGRGITFYASNDPKILISRCAEDLRLPLEDPFEKEEFLVQSRGMSSWLKLRMTDELGVFANASFRFPEEMIWMILRGFLGEGPKRNPYTKETMAWKIFDLLPSLIRGEEEALFAPVSRYLLSGTDGKEWNADRTFRFCRQVATLYDSYLTYRPEMIVTWTQGRLPDGGNQWQGVLWQALRKALNEQSLPELALKLRKVKPARQDWLPARLSVFGISTLPPVFLDVLRAYGRFRPLRFYALQPAPVMWGEVESEKTLAKWKERAIKRAKDQAQRKVSEDELNELEGNPLIGSLGRTGREFFNLLIDRDAHDFPLAFRKPEGGSLLARLQRWTFEVFSRQPEERKPLDGNDESIVINNCHGAMREAEVLRDYLLRRFAEDPTLRPRDVVVMMPDPEGYAPYIRATFGGMEKGMPEFFPFSIVDREPRGESQLIDCFFDLLEFFEGRATNRELMDLLDSTVLRTKFELDDDDIDAFRGWIRTCHAHWGLTGEHRQRFGSVKTEEHTWRHAMDRMALGFCMSSDGNKRMWDQVLPFDEIEGENAKRFAKLNWVIDALTESEETASREQSLADWAGFLTQLTNRFFPSSNETLMDRLRVQKAIGALLSEYSLLVGKSVVPLRVIRYHLSNVLEAGVPQGQFMTSGVTFCGLRPMRSVSARVICLVGMDEGAFPRQTRKPSFDLSGNRRAGDRSAREDDRYLFLETIWCAQEYLYLSYVGQSIRQSQRIPPSVVVNELLDGLDQLVDFGKRDGRSLKARDEFVRLQTLHSFGKENFLGGRIMRSFSSDHLDAAKSLLDPDAETPPFLVERMSGLEEELEELTMDDLILFFENPSQSFLKKRLGISLWDENPPPDESEPLDLGNLEKYAIKRRLLGIALELEEDSDLLALQKAEGALPPGSLGEVWFNEAKREVDRFIEQWGEELKGEKEKLVVVDEEFNGIRLRGELGPFVNRRQILYRCVQEIKGKDRLRSWIRHLFASAFAGQAMETRFYSSDRKCLRLKPLPKDSARELIRELIELYARGMREALPFFPESSFAFESARQKQTAGGKNGGAENTEGKALVEAQKKWNSGMRHTGEREDSANRLCFREEPFDDPVFAELAKKVYGPFIQSSGSEEEGCE